MIGLTNEQAEHMRGQMFMGEVEFVLERITLDHIEEKIWDGFLKRQTDRELSDWLGLSVTEIRSKRQNLYSKIGYQVAEDYRRVQNRQGFLSRKEDNGQTDGKADENLDNA